MTTLTHVLTVLSAGLVLSACGGGGSGGEGMNPTPQAGPTAEQNASSSVEGLIGYTSDLTASPTEQTDSQEAVNVEAITPPTSETAEPLDVG